MPRVAPISGVGLLTATAAMATMGHALIVAQTAKMAKIIWAFTTQQHDSRRGYCILTSTIEAVYKLKLYIKNVIQIIHMWTRGFGRQEVHRMRLVWLWALWLGIACTAQAEGAVVPASGQGCATGWDQLLSPEQRARAAPVRACQATKTNAANSDSAQASAFPRSPQAPLTIVKTGPRRPGKQRVLAPSFKRQLASQQAAQPIRSDAMPVVLAPLIDYVARVHNIDPLLLHAIARVESRHQPGAVSPAGAHGLMQVIVPTAQQFGVGNARELHDPLTNLYVSALYLKKVQARFGNDLPLVLAAYNAGEGAVERYGWRVPPYRETQDYVRKVLAEYSLLLRVSGRQSFAAALSRIQS
jgi:lysozyme